MRTMTHQRFEHHSAVCMNLVSSHPNMLPCHAAGESTARRPSRATCIPGSTGDAPTKTATSSGTHRPQRMAAPKSATTAAMRTAPRPPKWLAAVVAQVPHAATQALPAPPGTRTRAPPHPPAAAPQQHPPAPAQLQCPPQRARQSLRALRVHMHSPWARVQG